MNKQAENVKTDEQAVALSGFECVTKFIDENLESAESVQACAGGLGSLMDCGKQAESQITLLK